eukprot:CAMPEP_0206418766 /NCGR_PEP_ID=MMETSP0294-20121207/38216_1 /ASSEMBLY_ACC=CAM_ASM_000327 /TAXON_ID=39354 /ORGANISM="Heterosigma akashiwo, Strain CCMP2393" /LENGTH=210 /DNA_ID=CAMNT_0053882031 /DNA_START=247 /DNA_END=878 /DNA_ORIENTATION=-
MRLLYKAVHLQEKLLRDVVRELVAPAGPPQLPQRLRLDLAHALVADAQLLPDLPQGVPVAVAAQTKALPQNVLLAGGQRGERRPTPFLELLRGKAGQLRKFCCAWLFAVSAIVLLLRPADLAQRVVYVVGETHSPALMGDCAKDTMPSHQEAYLEKLPFEGSNKSTALCREQVPSWTRSWNRIPVKCWYDLEMKRTCRRLALISADRHWV